MVDRLEKLPIISKSFWRRSYSIVRHRDIKFIEIYFVVVKLQNLIFKLLYLYSDCLITSKEDNFPFRSSSNLAEYDLAENELMVPLSGIVCLYPSAESVAWLTSQYTMFGKRPLIWLSAKLLMYRFIYNEWYLLCSD